MTRTYIGLGSNLQVPNKQIEAALDALMLLPKSSFLAASSLYRSKPLALKDQPEVSQPDYINAVASLETQLTAHDLLAHLQKIELDQGRVRGVRWGPRTLDLDLLLYGDETINTETLTVPHPGLKQRTFVLYPLVEIAPDLQLPCGESLKQVLQRFSSIPDKNSKNTYGQ